MTRRFFGGILAVGSLGCALARGQNGDRAQAPPTWAMFSFSSDFFRVSRQQDGNFVTIDGVVYSLVPVQNPAQNNVQLRSAKGLFRAQGRDTFAVTFLTEQQRQEELARRQAAEDRRRGPSHSVEVN